MAGLVGVNLRVLGLLVETPPLNSNVVARLGLPVGNTPQLVPGYCKLEYAVGIGRPAQLSTVPIKVGCNVPASITCKSTSALFAMMLFRAKRTLGVPGVLVLRTVDKTP
jgi:hypothetical protein